MYIHHALPFGYTISHSNGTYTARHDGDIVGSYPRHHEACEACIAHSRNVLPAPPSEIVVDTAGWED